MNYVNRVRILSLVVVLVALVGCKSKQETPPEKAAAPSAAPAPGKPAATAVSPEDMAAARTAALRVLGEMEAGDFATIYKEASPAFKQIGSEVAFATRFQQTRQKTGVFKNPKEVKFDTRPDNIHVLVYRLENQHFTTEMRLSFERAKNGTMELVGLNQHDEPKK